MRERPLRASTSPTVAALRATWPDGLCPDTGIHFGDGVEIPLPSMDTRGGQVSWDDAPSGWPQMTGKTVFTRD